MISILPYSKIMSLIKYVSIANSNFVGFSFKSLLSFMAGFNILFIIHMERNFIVYIHIYVYTYTHICVCMFIYIHMIL